MGDGEDIKLMLPLRYKRNSPLVLRVLQKNQDGGDVYHVYLFKENLRYTQNEKKNPTDGNEKPSIVCSRPIMVELSFLHF